MIKDLQLGNAMEQPCLVRLQKVGTSSNGKPYAKGLLEKTTAGAFPSSVSKPVPSVGCGPWNNLLPT